MNNGYDGHDGIGDIVPYEIRFPEQSSHQDRLITDEGHQHIESTEVPLHRETGPKRGGHLLDVINHRPQSTPTLAISFPASIGHHGVHHPSADRSVTDNMAAQSRPPNAYEDDEYFFDRYLPFRSNGGRLATKYNGPRFQGYIMRDNELHGLYVQLRGEADKAHQLASLKTVIIRMYNARKKALNDLIPLEELATVSEVDHTARPSQKRGLPPLGRHT